MKIVRLSSGLGNQLFMYAFYKHIEQRYNEPIFFDDKYFQHDGSGRKPEISILTQYRTYRFPFNPAGEKGVKRKLFQFKQIVFPSFKFIQEEEYNDSHIYDGNTYFNGYWQTDEYVNKLQKSLFIPSVDFPDLLSDVKQKIIHSSCPVCIHFRRGDYFSPRYIHRYGVCTTDYYFRAMRLLEDSIEKDITYFVFSDDLEWVKSNIKFDHPCFFVPNHKVNSIWYIVLMSLCKHNIISNSSFSWWGAYLNANLDKIVIGPEKWTFDSDKNIMCKSWTKIKV